MKADQVMDIIENMEVEEKWELLEKMYQLYYKTRVERSRGFEEN